MRRALLPCAAVACAAGLAYAAPARAQIRAFDVPAQAAVTAIPEFARQAGVQVIAPADHLAGVRTSALRGAMPARTALRRLIAGTGLEIASDDGFTIALRRRLPSGAGAPAAQPPPRPEPAPPGPADLDPLTVFGRGQARQVQYVRGTERDRALPGASPLALVDKLPSVNYGAGDAFGLNEWSARISIRGFMQDRLGFTLDGVPLGDMTYGNRNGLHIARAVTAENLDSVELAQGPSSLDTPSTSNLGGTIRFQTREPADEPGAYAVLAGGSDSTFRGVLRVETGETPSGLRAYASYGYHTTVRWQGAGEQSVSQLNLKAVQAVSDGAVTAFVNLSRRRESDPQDLSQEMIGRLGLGWDNLVDDWPLAVRLAEIAHNRGDTGVTGAHPEFGVEYPAPITDVDDAYHDSTTIRDDALAAVSVRRTLSEAVEVASTAYAHWNRGEGLWWTPYVPSPNYGVAGAGGDDAPISIRATEYDIRRSGALGSVAVRLGPHAVSAGAWVEQNDFVQSRRFYGLDRVAPQRRSRAFQHDPFRTDWSYHFDTTTWQVHLQDEWRASEDLTINAGFKSLSVTSHVATRAGPEKSGSIRARRLLLPQAGFRFRLSAQSEVFGDYGRSMRAFPASNTSGPFAATRVAFEASRGRLKPEVADSFELGWRAQTDDVMVLAAAYRVLFRDRLFSTPVGQGIVGNPPAIANVGGVTAYGLESAVSWRVGPDWTLFGSYAYGRATYDSDVFDGDGRLIARTRGKAAVDAPEHILKGRIEYQRNGLFARLGVAFVSRRFYTYENDRSVPSHTVADLTLGYRFSGAPLEGLEAQVSVTNLFDEGYVSTLGTNDYPVRGDAQTLIAGAPSQAFIALRRAF